MSNGTDPPFRGMLVESAIAKANVENKTAIEKGTNSSLDRMEAMVNNTNNTSSLIKNTYNPTGINNPVQNFQPKSAVSSESQIMRNPQDVKNEEMKQRSRDRDDAKYGSSIIDLPEELQYDKHGNRLTKKESAENAAAWDTRAQMNQEKGLFPGGSRTNQYGQSMATAQGDAKRRFQGGSPIYSFADDLTRSATGSMVEASKKGTWDGGVPNVLGALGKPLSWMGVGEEGVGIGEVAKQLAWHAPGSGELMDAYHLGKDIYKGMTGGGFSDAKLSLGALAVPFASAGDAKNAYRATKQLFKGSSNLTNITGNMSKFSKRTGDISQNLSRNNPFKIGENVTLNLANRAGLSKGVDMFKTAKDQYKRNILQQKSIEKQKNEPIAVKTNKNIKPIG